MPVTATSAERSVLCVISRNVTEPEPLYCKVNTVPAATAVPTVHTTFPSPVVLPLLKLGPPLATSIQPQSVKVITSPAEIFASATIFTVFVEPTEFQPKTAKSPGLKAAFAFDTNTLEKKASKAKVSNLVSFKMVLQRVCRR